MPGPAVPCALLIALHWRGALDQGALHPETDLPRLRTTNTEQRSDAPEWNIVVPTKTRSVADHPETKG